MDYFTPLDPESTPSFSGATLILVSLPQPERVQLGFPSLRVPPHLGLAALVQPQPSLGSVPQLATDLILHNHELTLIGYLGLRDHVPSVAGLDSLPGEKPTEGVSFATQGKLSAGLG